MASLTLAFDADDTLWHNESLFAITQKQFAELLAPYAEPERVEQHLNEAERRNLRYFGYGVKGFVLSMIETAIEISQGKVPAREIQLLIEAGKSMLSHPIELLPGVRETLTRLSPHYNLMMITKGDLFHQESRIAMSGLGELFSAIEVVSEKDPATYNRILRRYHLQPENFIMVGNSVRSDILPVLEVGARAVHIPYAITWVHEQADLSGANPERWVQLESMDQLPAWLEGLQAARRAWSGS